MSDTMFFGVLKMPFEMAMRDEISRIQFYARVQELVGRFEAQQQAEPVGQLQECLYGRGQVFWFDKPADKSVLYTALPQRPWVGLTDEEMSDTVADMDVDFGDLLWKVVCLTKIIEAKLKEKNGY